MIDRISIPDAWSRVKESARNTVGRDGEGQYPSPKWKKAILLAEHSPIRLIRATWRWKGLKYWVSVHMTRHRAYATFEAHLCKGLQRSPKPCISTVSECSPF